MTRTPGGDGAPPTAAAVGAMHKTASSMCLLTARAAITTSSSGGSNKDDDEALHARPKHRRCKSEECIHTWDLCLYYPSMFSFNIDSPTAFPKSPGVSKRHLSHHNLPTPPSVLLLGGSDAPPPPHAQPTLSTASQLRVSSSAPMISALLNSSDEDDDDEEATTAKDKAASGEDEENDEEGGSSEAGSSSSPIRKCSISSVSKTGVVRSSNTDMTPVETVFKHMFGGFPTEEQMREYVEMIALTHHYIMTTADFVGRLIAFYLTPLSACSSANTAGLDAQHTDQLIDDVRVRALHCMMKWAKHVDEFPPKLLEEAIVLVFGFLTERVRPEHQGYQREILRRLAVHLLPLIGPPRGSLTSQQQHQTTTGVVPERLETVRVLLEKTVTREEEWKTPAPDSFLFNVHAHHPLVVKFPPAQAQQILLHHGLPSAPPVVSSTTAQQSSPSSAGENNSTASAPVFEVTTTSSPTAPLPPSPPPPPLQTTSATPRHRPRRATASDSHTVVPTLISQGLLPPSAATGQQTESAPATARERRPSDISASAPSIASSALNSLFKFLKPFPSAASVSPSSPPPPPPPQSSSSVPNTPLKPITLSRGPSSPTSEIIHSLPSSSPSSASEEEERMIKPIPVSCVVPKLQISNAPPIEQTTTTTTTTITSPQSADRVEKKRGGSDPLLSIPMTPTSKVTPRSHTIRLARISNIIRDAVEVLHNVTPAALLMYWKSSSVTRLRQKNFKQLAHSFLASEGITAACNDLGITRDQAIALGRILQREKHLRAFPDKSLLFDDNAESLFYLPPRKGDKSDAEDDDESFPDGIVPIVQQPQPNQQPQPLSFTLIHPVEMARQLALKHHSLIRKIKFSELSMTGWQGPEAAQVAPHVLAFMEHSNRFSTWVAAEVVLTANAKERVAVLARFIDLAIQCRKIRSWNAMMDIMVGLQHPSVKRLGATFESLPRASQQSYRQLLLLSSYDKNYAAYREHVKLSKPSIPYVNLWLKDLAYIEEGNKLMVHNGVCVNTYKLKCIWKIFHQVLLVKAMKFKFKQVPQVLQFIEHSAGASYDAQALFHFSLEREPRERFNSEAKQTKGRLKDVFPIL